MSFNCTRLYVHDLAIGGACSDSGQLVAMVISPPRAWSMYSSSFAILYAHGMNDYPLGRASLTCDLRVNRIIPQVAQHTQGAHDTIGSPRAEVDMAMLFRDLSSMMGRRRAVCRDMSQRRQEEAVSENLDQHGAASGTKEINEALGGASVWIGNVDSRVGGLGQDDTLIEMLWV